MFFVYSGFNASNGRLAAPDTPWRRHGQPAHAALTIDALTNARGLIEEPVFLDIGLQRALIGLALFTVMVFVAMITTLTATPVFGWTANRHVAKSHA